MEISQAIDYLTNSQHPSGGWGYRTGHRPVVEATAVVLHALKEEETANAVFTCGMTWLLNCQHADGGWGINEEDGESGWQTAWALKAMKLTSQGEEGIQKAAEWLSSVETYAVTREEFIKAAFPVEVNLDALVWPWLPGQAGWLEPTALALLALNQTASQPLAGARIKTALDYFDRYRTPSGGWNIGNASPLDTIILPRAYQTALVLIALADIAPDHIQSSDLTALWQDLQRDTGILANAASLLAIKILGMNGDPISAYISANQLSDGSWEHNPFVTAWSILGFKGYL
jgi:Squalene-hopene cyclase C-terminal domain